jgi:peptidoglycan lytic transglycosylase G
MGWVLAPLLALAVLCALAVGGYDLYKGFQSKDFTGPGFGHVTVQVLPGDTATSLAPRLVKLGVVASVNSFISAAKHSANPTGLEPGFFSLHEHMNSALAYKMLLNPASRMQTVVAIPEGLRMSQIVTTLEKKYAGTIPASAFTSATKDTAALGLPSYANGNPEGYLFPATYDFNPKTSALGLLQAMVTRFNQEATTIGLPAAAQADHLTPGQVITVASILEAEAGTPKYYRQVAEVIYNRLNDGMKLGLDSTVNYALHRFGVHLTVSQLHVNSPYNTFIHTGLPPGPIDSPGDAAIQAALHPAHGNLLYFVTVNLKTGLTKFTSSAAQFQQFVAECQQNNAC